MPAHYAHYRFGAALIDGMPPEIRCYVQRFRQLYDVGLHGPDLFFYHNIFFHDAAVELGNQYHQQTGRDFFTKVCKHLRLEPNEAAVSYLYGVLAHYCLDSICHPYVNSLDEGGAVGHVELETDFDRHLLTLDGKRPAYTFDCSPHIRLTRGECNTVAAFYPPATPAMIHASVGNMARCVRFLSSPPGLKRSLLDAAVKATGDKFSPHVMGRNPNPKCAEPVAELMVLYTRALETYPRLLSQLAAHMKHNAPLGEEFEHPFG